MGHGVALGCGGRRCGGSVLVWLGNWGRGACAWSAIYCGGGAGRSQGSGAQLSSSDLQPGDHEPTSLVH
eukprot:3855819-Pyramimonas_sp.AAC.1